MLLFLKIMATEFIAEMGDKTQLMLVAMSNRYKVRDIVIGTGIAVLILNGIAAVFGGVVGEYVPDFIIKLVAAAAFLFFAATSLKKDDEEEEAKDSKIKLPILAVFGTFFVAELGDKTQLTAITFGANEGISKAVIVWFACSVGLFAADMIGMAVGLLLKSKMPTGFLNILAFVIFEIFGVITAREGLLLLLGEESPWVLIITIAAGVITLIASALIFILSRKKLKKGDNNNDNR